ncbi:MAG: hypothetical protein IPK80_17770 [Nannocystis sp.]|nr:hypothetical protein [Nannocystis sp.]
MLRRPPRALIASLPLVLAIACQGDDSDTTEGTATTSTSSTSTAATTGDSATTQTTDTDATTTAATTTSETTTTGEELCHYGSSGDSGGSAAPWLEVEHKGAPVSSGSVLDLECGLQGLFMFELVPYFGGFEPDGEIVELSIVVDVDGHNINPEGHFYSAANFNFYIGCDVFDGGIAYILPIIPPDTFGDVTQLDGLDADITVTLHPKDAAPVVVQAAVKLRVKPQEGWDFCQQGF